MADFVSSFHSPPSMSQASSSGAADEDCEDACSICLEPFNSDDPATVTNCRHEYHLQCILEWSQRSRECPICWQHLALKDASSQELLAATKNERNLRSRSTVCYVHEEQEVNFDASYADDSDYHERLMQHFAVAARRARNLSRIGRHRTSGIGPSQLSASAEDLPDVQQVSSIECQSTNTAANISIQCPPSVDAVPSTVVNRDGLTKPRIFCSTLPPENPGRQSSSELLVVPESIKSRFSAASARYKESISKSTQSMKEKLLARNVSVKDLGRGVQREMSAGIAGIARMIQHLEITPKRASVSVPLASCATRVSNIPCKGHTASESAVTEPVIEEDTSAGAHEVDSVAPPCLNNTIPGQLKVSTAQGGN